MSTMVRANNGYTLDAGKQEAQRGTTATAADVLVDKIFTTTDANGGIRATGSMANRGNADVELAGRGSTVTEQAGYYGQHTISVAEPSESSKKVLTASQYGDVDLSPYDYKYVNAAAVRTGGYNDGISYALNNSAKQGFYTNCFHLASNTFSDWVNLDISGQVWLFVTATIARPKGSGYATVNLSTASGLTELDSDTAQYSDETSQTNIYTKYGVYRMTEGSSIRVYNNSELGGTVNLTIMYWRYGV